MAEKTKAQLVREGLDSLLTVTNTMIDEAVNPKQGQKRNLRLLRPLELIQTNVGLALQHLNKYDERATPKAKETPAADGAAKGKK